MPTVMNTSTIIHLAFSFAPEALAVFQEFAPLQQCSYAVSD